MNTKKLKKQKYINSRKHQQKMKKTQQKDKKSKKYIKKFKSLNRTKKRYNGGGVINSLQRKSHNLGEKMDKFSNNLDYKFSKENIKEGLKEEWNRTKMRTNAIKNPIKNSIKGGITQILTMENPIVFAYQFIERNVFGLDTVAPERKMSATQKSMFGDMLKKKDKKTTLKEFAKGKYFVKSETDQQKKEREAKEKREKEEKDRQKILAIFQGTSNTKEETKKNNIIK